MGERIQFLHYEDFWSITKKKLREHGQVMKVGLTPRELFHAHVNEVRKTGDIASAQMLYKQLGTELVWIEQQRPYYQVFPALMPMLLKLNLDVPCSAVREFHINPICVRLPENDPNKNFSFVDPETKEDRRVHGIIMAKAAVSEHMVEECVILVDFRERDGDGNFITVLAFAFDSDKSVEEMIRAAPIRHSFFDGMRVPPKIMENIYRLCCCVRLIGNDPDLVCPDILGADSGKWDAASADERIRLIERAHRKGKVGWNIGADIEVMPHIRRPHPALVWHGEGKKLAKIVLRKGAVVHRSKLTEMPHGYEGSD